jgi:hypothetical protein
VERSQNLKILKYSGTKCTMYLFCGLRFFQIFAPEMGERQIPKAQILVNLKLRLNRVGHDTQNLKLLGSCKSKGRNIPGFISYTQVSLLIALNFNQKEFLTLAALHHILSCLPGRSEVQASPIRRWTPSLMLLKRCFPLDKENGTLLKGSTTACILMLVGLTMP